MKPKESPQDNNTSIDNYQKQVSRTLIDEPDFSLNGQEIMVLWNALGLAGEAGEVADIIKKALLHQHGLTTESLSAVYEELGDVLWYATALCIKLGFSLEMVMEANIRKVDKRYPKGYSSKSSLESFRALRSSPERFELP